MSNKVVSILQKILGLGPLNGYKTIIAAALTVLAKYIPGFPSLDILDGVSAQEIFLALAALQKLLEKFKK